MNNVQQKLEAYKRETGVSQETISKEMNLSASAISAWMKGKYKGDSDKITELVDQYLTRNQRRSVETKVIKMDFDFVETSIYTTISDGVQISDAYRQIRVIIGDSGVGKTTALKRIKDQRSNSVYVPVYAGIRKNRFLDKLCEAAGLVGYGSFDDKFELLVKNLTGTDRLILVDEVEHLPIDAVDALRRINDFTGCGVILAGLPVFLDRLAKYPEYTYIFNRMAIPIVLGRLNEIDVKKLVNTMVPPDCPITSPEWFQYCQGLGRDLKIIAQESLRVAALNGISTNSTSRFGEVVKTVIKSLARNIIK